MLPLIWVAILTFGAVFGNIPGKSALFDSEGEEECGNKQVDIVFVLDESSSIWGPDFTQELEFVQAVIESFDIGFNKTHIGVLTFADHERIIFQLREYYDKEQLKKAVKAIRQRSGETYTHLALKHTCQQMFSPTYTYSRPWVRHVAIVITDGNSSHPEETVKEAKLCHQENIQMIAIGVGQAVARKELEAIASSDDLVFPVDNYGALHGLQHRLSLKACGTPTTPPAPTTPTTTPDHYIEDCRKKIDHIWAISEFAGVSETNYALNFIKKVTNEIKIDPLFIQVGLAPRLCHEGAEIRLKDHDTKEWFWRDLDNYQLTGLYTHQTIEYLRLKGFTSENGARSDAVKFGILIVDFEAENWEKTLRQAELAKEEGIRLIIIGVGDNIRKDQLRQLAWPDEDYFYAKSYSQLDDLESKVIMRLCGCQGISTANPRARQQLRRFFEDFYSE